MSIIPNFTRFTTTSGVNAQIQTKIDLAEKGIANGVCPLDANGLINPSFYNPSVMQFLGTWDALINNPTLADGAGNTGDVYIVSIGGTQFTPTLDFVAGDLVVYDGTKWKRIDTNATNAYTKSEVDAMQALDLKKANNLSDVNNVATARTNINVYSKPETDALLIASNISATPYTYITGTNVESDLSQIDGALGNQQTQNGIFNSQIQTLNTNVATNTSNISTLDTTTLKTANNLSELTATAGTARNNLNVLSKLETYDLEKLILDGFSLTNFNFSSTGARNFYYNGINSIEIGAIGVLDLGIYSVDRVKYYDIRNYLSSITSGILYCYAYDAPLSGNGNYNDIKVNSFTINSLTSVTGDGRVIYNVTPISVLNTFNSLERVVIKIIKYTPPTAGATSASNTGHTYLTNTTVQGQLDQTDTQLLATTTAINNLNLNSLTDVDTITNPPVATNVLAYTGTDWRPAKGTDTTNITPSLLLNVPLDSLINSNTQTQDTSSYGLVGTLSGLNNTNLVSAKLGNGIQFLDVNNQYIQFPYASHLDFNINSSFTFNVWFKSTLSNTTAYLLFGCGSGVNGAGYFCTLQGNQGRVTFIMSDNSSTRQNNIDWNFGTANIFDNNWHMLTITKGINYGGYNSADVKLYLDGVLRDDVKTPTTISLLATDNIQSGQSFYIGNASSGFNSLRNTTVDNLSCFNFKMQDMNITSLYNNGAGTATYTAITNAVSHIHKIDDIIGLNTRLNTDEANISTNATNLNTHITNPTGAHTGTAISSTTAGRVYLNLANVDSQLTQADTMFQTQNTAINNNTTNITNHILSTTAHNATDITTTTNGYYISASEVQNNLGQLDTFTYNNTTNITSLTNNKIDTITSNDTQTLTVTGTGTSRALNPQTNTNNGLLKLNSTGTILSNGAIPIGNGTSFTTNIPTGTTNRIIVTPSAGGLNISAPQDLHTTAFTEFASAKLTGGLPISETLWLTTDQSRIRIDGNNASIVMSGTNGKIDLQGSNSQIILPSNGTALISGGGVRKNIIEECVFQILKKSANIAQTEYNITYTTNGSMNLTWNATVSGSWDRLMCFFLNSDRCINKMTQPKIPYFALQLKGSNWTGLNALQYLMMGYTTEETMSTIENWFTSDAVAFNLVWNTAPTSTEKAIGGRIVQNGTSNSILWNYGTTNNESTLYAGIGNAQANIDDIVLFHYNTTNQLFAISLHDVNNAWSFKTIGTRTSPSGTSMVQNFHCASIVPFYQTFYKTAGWEVQVMSQRDMNSLGFSLTDSGQVFESVFY